MTDLEKAVENIERYDAELGTSLGNVSNLQAQVSSARSDVQIIERAISKVEDFRDEVRAFDDDLGKLKVILNLIGKASALKAIADTGKTMIGQVENVTEKIDTKLKTVVQKIEQSGVTQSLRTVDQNLEKVEGGIGKVKGEIAAQKDAFESVADIAAALNTVTPDAIEATGKLVEVPLAIVSEINDFFDDEDRSDTDSVREYVLDFRTGTPKGDFSAFLNIEAEMDKVFGRLDAIRKPLDAVYDVLRPIEPLLAAADFVASLTVDPVIDFIKKTLGVQKLIDAAASKVNALLPDTGALDRLEGALDKVLAALDRYDFNTISAYDFEGDGNKDADPFNIGPWIFDELQSRLLEATLNGVASKIGTLNANGGIAIEIPEGVRGADADDRLAAAFTPQGGTVPILLNNLLLIGDNNDNEILASGGDNALYGGRGNDRLVGAQGAGTDTAVFTGPLSQYTFTRSSDTSPVIIEQISPLAGKSLDGRDTLIDIEEVMFLGGGSEPAITLTINQLFNNVAPVPAGTSENRSLETEGVFLFGQGSSTTVTRLEGGSGDDLLSGTNGNDELIGNGGDDDLRSQAGFDLMDGGAGNDTFTYFDDGVGGGGAVRLDLAAPINARGAHFTITGLSEVTLVDVENVLVREKRPTYLFGDDEGNILSSGALRDVLDGRGGDDTLLGGADGDILIGGAGKDSLFGEDGNDQLVVGDVAVMGVGQSYDGGDGLDTLFYTSDIDGILDRADLRNLGDNFVLPRAETQLGSGPITVEEDGSVTRLNADRSVELATDTLVSIESVVGSEFDDVLYGSVQIASLAGAGGDDLIVALDATRSISTGSGIDHVVAGLGGANYRGGTTDTLDLGTSMLTTEQKERREDVRFLARDTSSGGSGKLQAFAAQDLQDIDASKPFTQYNGGTLSGFGTFIGSDFDDQFDLTRSYDTFVYGGAGNDRIDVHVTGTKTSNGQTYHVYGEEGDDKITVGHTAIADGGLGNDEILVDLPASRSVTVTGGAGNDFVFARSGSGHFDGGEDPDTDNTDFDFISANPGTPLGGLNIDLANGTIADLNGRFVNATLSNFEGAIGSFRDNDILSGSANGDVLIGGGGNDLLEGLDGINGRPDIGTWHSVQTSAHFEDSWTLEAEVTTTTNDMSFQRIVSKPFGGAQTFSLAIVEGEAHIRFDTTSSGARFVQGGVINDGKTHQIGARYDEAAGTLSLFVDGVLIDSLDVSGAEPRSSGTSAITIGNFSSSFTQVFDGDIHQVRVWQSARSDAQIVAPFDALADPGSETDLQLALMFNGDSVTDASANAYDVTTFDATSGNDLLYGGSGSDRLYGGDGDDLLHGGSGFDDLYGGLGNDTASYANSAPGADRSTTEQSIHITRGIYVDLATGYAGPSPRADGPRDRLFSIENVIGSLSNDSLYGDDGANALNGGDGDDLMDGRGGNDRLVISGNDTARGGDGDDYISLGAGNASIDGGAGKDTLFTDDTLGDVLYNAASGTYRSEFLISTPVWADTGTTEARLLDGTSYTPQDVLETDPIYAKTLLTGPQINDPALAIVFTDVATQFTGTFAGIEVFEGGLFVDAAATEGDDVLGGLGEDDMFDGLGGNDRMVGHRGDDMFLAGFGDDIHDGGEGSDTVSYADASARVAVYLGQGKQDVGAGLGMDSFVSIENVVGSAFKDRLSGNASDNHIRGGEGDDFITGLAGNDRLDGEGGNDTLIGQGGNDRLSGGDGDDLLRGLGGDDQLFGDAGNDRIEGGVGKDEILGGEGDDVVFANFGNDVIFGEDGNDDLRGGGRQDFINGGNGNDKLIGGNGRDELIGAAGNNVLTGGGGIGNGDGARDVFTFFDLSRFEGQPRGFDRIRDFEDTLDKIDIRDLGYNGFTEIRADASQVGAHVQLNLDGGNLVQIENFTMDALTEGDFIF